MSFFDKLFKAKSQPEEKVDEEKKRSDELMERLKMRRGQETGKWLLMMENAGKEPPPTGPAPTIEDVDERQVLDEKPYTPPIEAQFMSLAPEQGEGSVIPFGQEARSEANAVAAAHNSAQIEPNQTTFQEEIPQQAAAPKTDAQSHESGFQSNRLLDQINMLATWSACDALIKVIDSDLAWLGGRHGSADLAANQSQYLAELSAELNALRGQVDGLVANYRPTDESKPA
ncbi:MAG TPA: hypothetical protein V6C89_21575 [Drouetiella sp.]|jgi:hypothetical protein